MADRGQPIVIGIDSGTQSVKVLCVSAETGNVIASATAPHALIDHLPPGHMEQHPADWFDAMEQAMVTALNSPGVDPYAVVAIGVSGQQHGFVPLDERDQVIRPAKLWCDTCTAPQCETILTRAGGINRYVEWTGNGLPAGFTASKIAWLAENEPDHFARLATVLLPHDYLNFRLTGAKRMECGDASGTALFDVRHRQWSLDAINALGCDLNEKLPELMPPDQPCGTLLAELAARWGLPAEVLVSPGGGDNMMSAIGTGNVTPGVETVSLGTSGTIFAYSPKPVIDPVGEVASFCDSTGAWLPLVCTMNVTVATELTKTLFGMDNAALEEAVRSVPPGADGLMLIPYFEGERTPNVPNGTGVWFGANRRTQTPAHFARAAMEGATLSLAYGLNRFRELGVSPSEIRLTGGGSNSPAWRQICADVFGAPVVCLKQSESAAFGAALQAKWIVECQRDPSVSIVDIADQWVQTRDDTRAHPDQMRSDYYTERLQLHNQLSSALRPSFDRHRMLVSH